MTAGRRLRIACRLSTRGANMHKVSTSGLGKIVPRRSPARPISKMVSIPWVVPISGLVVAPSGSHIVMCVTLNNRSWGLQVALCPWVVPSTPNDQACPEICLFVGSPRLRVTTAALDCRHCNGANMRARGPRLEMMSERGPRLPYGVP